MKLLLKDVLYVSVWYLWWHRPFFDMEPIMPDFVRFERAMFSATWIPNESSSSWLSPICNNISSELPDYLTYDKIWIESSCTVMIYRSIWNFLWNLAKIKAASSNPKLPQALDNFKPYWSFPILNSNNERHHTNDIYRLFIGIKNFELSRSLDSIS